MNSKFAVITEKETCRIKLEEINPAVLRADQFLVKAHYSVISAGTELAGFSALSPGVYRKGAWNAYPWRSGYGLVGLIHSLAADKQRFEERDRVFCFGTHSQYQAWPPGDADENPLFSMFPVNNTLDDETIAASRMALVAVTAPQISGIKLGDSVAVFGLGMVGNIAAQYYKHLGARVLGFDPVKFRCQKAKELGINEVFDVSPEKQVEMVMQATGGRGADITVDAAGSSSVVMNCVASTADNGKVVLLGTPRAAVTANLTELLRPVHLRCLQILGAFEWRLPAYRQAGVPHSIESNLEMIWRLIHAGDLRVKELITHIIEPEEMQSAYAGLLNDKDHYLGVLVDWT